MLISLLLQVYFRYIVGKSLPWTEELSRFAFLFLVFLVIGISVKKRSHIRITVQFNFLPPKAKKIAMIISDTIWFAFNWIVIYQGFKLFLEMGNSDKSQISPVLEWDLRYIYVILPIGFLLMNLRLIENYIVEFMGKRIRRRHRCQSN